MRARTTTTSLTTTCIQVQRINWPGRYHVTTNALKL